MLTPRCVPPNTLGEGTPSCPTPSPSYLGESRLATFQGKRTWNPRKQQFEGKEQRLEDIAESARLAGIPFSTQAREHQPLPPARRATSSNPIGLTSFPGYDRPFPRRALSRDMTAFFQGKPFPGRRTGLSRAFPGDRLPQLILGKAGKAPGNGLSRERPRCPGDAKPPRYVGNRALHSVTTELAARADLCCLPSAGEVLAKIVAAPITRTATAIAKIIPAFSAQWPISPADWCNDCGARDTRRYGDQTELRLWR